MFSSPTCCLSNINMKLDARKAINVKIFDRDNKSETSAVDLHRWLYLDYKLYTRHVYKYKLSNKEFGQFIKLTTIFSGKVISAFLNKWMWSKY